jgi:hypothetical protein
MSFCSQELSWEYTGSEACDRPPDGSHLVTINPRPAKNFVNRGTKKNPTPPSLVTKKWIEELLLPQARAWHRQASRPGSKRRRRVMTTKAPLSAHQGGDGAEEVPPPPPHEFEEVPPPPACGGAGAAASGGRFSSCTNWWGSQLVSQLISRSFQQAVTGGHSSQGPKT